VRRTEPAAQPLAAAAAGRTLAAEERVRAALREMDKEGFSMTFASVAQRAGVSRQFLYTHQDFRREIESLRAAEQDIPSRLPVKQRAGDASVRARLRTALDDNKRLREEVARRNEELALAHGRVRELELNRRIGA